MSEVLIPLLHRRLPEKSVDSGNPIYHGNPQASIFRGITHILGVENLHFSWFWGPRVAGWKIDSLFIDSEITYLEILGKYPACSFCVILYQKSSFIVYHPK